MKRKYVDLHLCPNIQDAEGTRCLVDKASALGYDAVGIALPVGAGEKERWLVQSICDAADVEMVSRVDLRPRTPDELLALLRRVRRRFEVVAVMCESKTVARQAAKDRRVDLLGFPQLDFRRRFFDRAEAELASGCSASLEVDVQPLLMLEGTPRIRLLSNLRRETTIATGFHVPIVLSSGTCNANLLRRPADMAALGSLFHLVSSAGLEAVSKAPLGIVERNRQKLGAGFVAPGIWVVRRGKDC